jgi:hypothetical protein
MSANLYERDFYAWTLEQAAKLRAGRLSELDIEHLIEEMESMGATERREVIGRLTVLLAHLLKWQFQPSHRGRSWQLTIAIQRRDVEQVLKQNPSLRGRLGEFFGDAYASAVLKAAKETRLSVKRFPEAPPFTVEQALDDGFWPE